MSSLSGLNCGTLYTLSARAFQTVMASSRVEIEQPIPELGSSQNRLVLNPPYIVEFEFAVLYLLLRPGIYGFSCLVVFAGEKVDRHKCSRPLSTPPHIVVGAPLHRVLYLAVLQLQT